jgi:FkbM family methyltransferase
MRAAARLASMLMIADAVRRLFGYRFPPLGSAAHQLFFRLLPAGGRVEIFPGVRADLNFRDATMRATYWQGDRFETPTMHVLRGWVVAGATHFFDMGSNYGFFSFGLASAFPELCVHAFEPNPATFAQLQAICRQNRLERIHCWNLGLADLAQRLPLRGGKADSGHSTFGPHPELPLTSTEEINLVTFDEWRRVNGLELPSHPSWIAKLDVEGFEARVLAGMSEALNARAFSGLVVEMNPFTLGFCNSSPAEIEEFLAKRGYHPQPRSEKCGNSFFTPARDR